MRRLLLPITVVALAVAGTAPTLAAADAMRTGRLLVKLRAAGVSWPSLTGAVAQRAGARRTGRDMPEIGLLTLRPRRGDTPAALRRRLLRDPRVVRVEAEIRGEPRFTPNDPALHTIEAWPGTAPNTLMEWWAAKSGFTAAWDRSDGRGTRVAVIDSGIDVEHPDLAGRVTVSKSFDPEHKNAKVDELGHGTHVASLACGAADNGIGLAGAGFGCSILNAKTSFADSEVAKAIRWATDSGADVINMSFGAEPGSPKSTIVDDELERAAQRNVVLVAAAADVPETDQGHPANLVQRAGTAPDLDEGLGITVTAANFSDAPAAAGHGDQISMAAYGAYDGQLGPPGLFGAFPAARSGFENGDPTMNRLPCGCRSALAGDPRYGYLEGTSMATALVSGAAALVRSLNPDLTAREVVRLLKETARQPGGEGWRPELGWGILDADAALAQAGTMDRRAPTSRATDVPARRPPGKVRPGYTSSDRAPAGVTPAEVKRVDIYVRVDRRPWRRMASVVPGHKAPQVTLRAGHRYAFVTSAVDRMNNRERRPKRPDQTIVVEP